MQLLLKICRSCLWRRGLVLLTCIIFALGLFVPLAMQVQAEGSRNMYSGTNGNRANLNWRTGIFGQLLIRRTLLKVYAKSNEFILLASTAISDTSNFDPAPGTGDILIYTDAQVNGTVGNETLGAFAFSCLDQRVSLNNFTLGDITSRAAELAGPDTIVDTSTGQQGNPADNTYAPCFYDVPTDGIYYVAFYGPEGGNSDVFQPPNIIGDIDLADPRDFDGRQRTSIAAWDVTVRDSLTSNTDINGRLFTDYLAMVTGDNQRPLFSDLFVLTRDGYIYETNLGGLDPNAFVFFANNVGFLDKNEPLVDPGVALYRDVLGTDDNLADLDLNGLALSPPNQLIFFNDPDPEAIAANGISAPIAPQITSITFSGSLGGNDTLVGVGGTFTYTSNTDGIYELILSRDGLNFDPTEPTNRVLRGFGSSPVQTVAWDGLDNVGTAFPAALNYPLRIILRAGEYHFPLLDAENSAGGPHYTLTNPPGGCPSFNGGAANCSIAFYDDRGYTTLSGDNIGTPGLILPGNGQPNPDRSDPLGGFDTSTSNQRAFGDGTGNGFGDRKGLDIWTYFPSNILTTTLNIFDTPPTPTPTPTFTPTPTDPAADTPTPTATSTATPTDPSSSNTPTSTPKSPSGSEGGNTPPPGATPTPASVAFAPVGPTSTVFPVAFLPETGLKESELRSLGLMAGLLLIVVVGGFSLIIRSRHKD